MCDPYHGVPGVPPQRGLAGNKWPGLDEGEGSEVSAFHTDRKEEPKNSVIKINTT